MSPRTDLASQRPDVPGISESDKIVLFDGVCNLCSRAVRFIIRNDPAAVFKFSSLQSPAATALVKGRIIDNNDMKSVILVENGVFYTRSTAVLRIAAKLSWPWRICGSLLVVPRPIRDVVYKIVASNRYRLFGKSDACLVPTAEIKSRFIDFA